jgi:AraC-type transcriptional regulator
MPEPSPFGSRILALVTRSLVRVAESEGLNADELLAAAGLSWSALEDPDVYLPIARHLALGVAITDGLGPVNGGLRSGAAIYGDPRGALGFAIRRSGTQRRALGRFCRFVSITNESVRLSCEETSEGMSLRAEMIPGLAALGHPTEALFSAWVSIARVATGVRWAPVRVAFRHAPRGPAAEHLQFFGCPVEFGAQASSLCITSEALDLAILETPHAFDATLVGLEEQLLAGSPGPPAVAAAERLLAELAGGQVDVVEAHDPGLRLRAARLLSAAVPALPAYEIAFWLGFDGVEALREALAPPAARGSRAERPL